MTHTIPRVVAERVAGRRHWSVSGTTPASHDPYDRRTRLSVRLYRPGDSFESIAGDGDGRLFEDWQAASDYALEWREVFADELEG